MELASQAQVEALDPEFGQTATDVGRYAWSLADLTMREKTLAFIAADLAELVLAFARFLTSQFDQRWTPACCQTHADQCRYEPRRGHG